MKKHVLILAALLGIAAMFSCNAQKTKSVDASELAEAIGSMTEDTNFVVTGELTTFNGISDAISNSNYKVGLDLSKTTGLTKIKGGPFYGISRLSSITIPNSVTEIGKLAFSYCGVKSVTIPDSVTEIGDQAFSNCTGLTSITIPDSVTEIGELAFSDCTGLTSITIPDSVTKIGRLAFQDCTGLTSVTILDGVTEIGELAFSGCTGLTSVTIPDSVTGIGGYGFGEKEISNAFSVCSGLEKIIVSKGNKVYDSRHNCNAIIRTEYNRLVAGCKNTVIPNDVTGIGKEAFRGSTGLKSLIIPDSVTEIGSWAFADCAAGLEKITVSEGNKVYDSRHNCNAIISTEDNTLLVGCKNTVIPNNVIQIGEKAFSRCARLTSITIPDSVTKISRNAFQGCTGLKSVTIPSSVTYIGDWAFYGCTGLTSITIPDSVTEIATSAFVDCTNLKTINASERVKEMVRKAM